MNRYFRYLLLAIFIIAVLLIVFLQFNSNRSINKLIQGNENLLGDLAIKTNLQRLQTNIITLESKLRGAIISGSAVDSEHLYEEINSVNESLKKLDILGNDKSIRPLLGNLNRQVNSKIVYNREVLVTFRIRGKKQAEEMINTQLGKKLTDSIRTVCNQIDALHQIAVIALIHEADANGQRARILGSIMAVIAVIVSLFAFAYVTYELRRQQQLIARLNISEKKANEAAAIKENFLANMSHEIRTPLNAILGFTSLLQTKKLDGQTKEFVQTIQRSGENLMAIVNDVLDLSKIEAGMMRIEATPFSVRALVHSVTTMFKPKAAEKKLRLCATVSEEVPDTLEGDATRLTQILVNLIGNAIKFTSSGNIDIQITNKGITSNRISTGITVKDTGIGIAKEQLSKIFERFQQAEDSVTRRYGGTGLGLSIAYELVQLQHGRIQVQSIPGAGTSFEIVIPYTVAAAPARNNMIPQIPFKPPPDGIKILVVEDNEINQNLVRHLFTSWNLSFDISSNGKEAIDRLQQHSYNIILMDIQMPEMDGYTAVQVIRQTLRLDTPVIAMTAHAMPGEREKCLSYGMNEYISKPIKQEQLLQLIAQFTGNPDTTLPEQQSSSGRHNHAFRYIDLQYMKEISQGDREYEKTVTAQFLEMVAAHLKDIQQYWQKGNIAGLKQTAHNMKTSVSIMGLTEQLLPWLDALEHEPLTETSFQRYYTSVKEISRSASEEAREFYNTLM